MKGIFNKKVLYIVYTSVHIFCIYLIELIVFRITRHW